MTSTILDFTRLVIDDFKTENGLTSITPHPTPSEEVRYP